jgi:hypothetical protein
MFIGDHLNGNFTAEAHPDSIFMRYMWKENFNIKLINNEPKL